MWINVEYLLTNSPMEEKFQNHDKYVENVLVVHIPFTCVLYQSYHCDQ